jgi:hypothetical protein
MPVRAEDAVSIVSSGVAFAGKWSSCAPVCRGARIAVHRSSTSGSSAASTLAEPGGEGCICSHADARDQAERSQSWGRP